jgi:hypothetical protein
MANSRQRQPEDGAPEPTAQIVTDAAPPDRQRVDPERIAQRAYERFQQRGAEHGRDQEAWLDAERDLQADD